VSLSEANPEVINISAAVVLEGVLMALYTVIASKIRVQEASRVTL
jgi:hypothetical protein